MYDSEVVLCNPTKSNAVKNWPELNCGICLACVKPWVQSSVLEKTKGQGKWSKDLSSCFWKEDIEKTDKHWRNTLSLREGVMKITVGCCLTPIKVAATKIIR